MKTKKIGGIKVDVKEATNQAIRYLKYNPCIACSCESFCDIKYKGTCPVWRKLRCALTWVKEVE